MVGANRVQILPVRRASSTVSRTGSKDDDGSPSSDSADDEGNDGARGKQTKKARASRPKVRTGCVTCKIRRVKCDEVGTIYSR